MKGLIILASLILASHLLFAQKTLTGKITDKFSGAPLAGSSIKIKGSKKGVSTNNEGIFTLQVNPKDILIITNIGYTEQSVPVPWTSSINILLEPVSSELTQVIFVGSRGAARTKTESPVPVDVIKVSDVGQSTARPDLMSQLNIAVPSFNYNKQSGADGSDANDFASLRGLGFDQTLVLINGKRRHLSAFVVQEGTRGRGNSGTDLNAIPEASIDRVEILRDGASAQYGSDAIAGVINIILKKDINHLNITTGGSVYDDHKYNAQNFVDPSQYYTGPRLDGAAYSLGADYGLAIGKNGGFINFAGNFLDQGKTFREEPDTNMSTNPTALPINGVRRAFGDGSVIGGGVMVNAEIPIARTRTKFYFFGGYNRKLSDVYAYTRNFSGNPQKFPTNPDGTLIFDANIMKVAGASDGSINSNNVYYDPQERVYVTDKSFAAGLEGTIGKGWDWDISNVIGNNDFHYHGYETFNASLDNVPGSLKTSFDDGGFTFTQNTSNLDVNRHFDNVAQGLTFSFGGEYRYERYHLYAGEPDSYGYASAVKFFPNLSGNGEGDSVQAPATGSEGYPGYQPTDATVAHRTNVGGYVDFALDITHEWLIDAAARFENYSDFGFVNTYKLATRYKLTDNFNLRGSLSTGFRAPSLQQMSFSNTNTNVVNGQLVYVKLVPNYSPIARAAGIPKLTQETSVNGSFGFSWLLSHDLTATVDGYWVQMKHRVVITGNFNGSVPAIAPYLTQYDVSSVNFFANAVNTTNTGVDIVLDYNKRLGRNSRFKATLAGNIQNCNIDKINIPSVLNTSYANQQAFYSTREQYFLKASAPRAKGTLALEYSLQKFAVGTRFTYFGKVVTQGFGYASLPGAPAGGPGGAGISDQGLGWDPYVETDNGESVVPENFVHHGKITSDAYVSYKVSKNMVWYAGVDNIFNVHPNLSIISNARIESAYDSESGGPFDSIQMGYDGLRIYSKFVFNF
jgi:iron complex outermembrane receptor protein